MFRQELDFFITNQDRLVAQYRGKVLVIKGQEVVGAYETALEAYREAKKDFELGTFMLQPCVAGPQAYTVTISSVGVIK